MEPFEYCEARDAAEAFSLVQDGPAPARWLAGGTDLVPLMKDGVIHPQRLVDIKRLRDLEAGIRETAEGVTVGALTTLAEVAGSPLLESRAGLLVEAARHAATPQLRAMATVGGNLLQRPRCWYFRNPAFHCWLKGGEECPAREGRNDRHAVFFGGNGSPCCAVHPSDLAPCLEALDAQALLQSPHGREWLVPVAGLFQPPSPARRTETVIEDALLLELRLPNSLPGTRTGFHKVMARRSFGFALASVALRLVLDGTRIADVRVVLGGVAGTPWRAEPVEAVLREAEISETLFERAARQAVAGAEPLAHNAYKLRLVQGLMVRALREACR